MKKILVIEDEQDIRLNLVKALEYEGFEAIDAEDGRRGIVMAREHFPDLIICDIRMPKLSGYGVLIELRRDQRTAGIPFIFLTAKTGKKDRQKGIQLGTDAYLTKPFELDELLAAVASTLLKKDTDVSKQLETLRYNLARTLPFKLQLPLTGILGFSGLLAEFGSAMLPEPGELVEIQACIYENALRLQRLMGNHLLYAELQLAEYDPERRKHWQERVSVRPNAIITAAATQKALEFERQDDLVCDLVETEIKISIESLQKMVEELLDNALTYSEAGTAICVTATVNGPRFLLSVADQGRGMTTDQIVRATSPRSWERKHGEPLWGGLGLPITRLLAQMYGGDISISSVPNQGTTVTIGLP